MSGPVPSSQPTGSLGSSLAEPNTTCNRHHCHRHCHHHCRRQHYHHSYCDYSYCDHGQYICNCSKSVYRNFCRKKTKKFIILWIDFRELLLFSEWNPYQWQSHLKESKLKKLSTSFQQIVEEHIYTTLPVKCTGIPPKKCHKIVWYAFKLSDTENCNISKLSWIGVYLCCMVRGHY